MLKVELNVQQRRELEDFRRQASSNNSEKALIILLSNDGKRVQEIADMLKRNPHTVRLWIKRYAKKGIVGLSRNYSPGRPRDKKESAKLHIKELLINSPQEYGYLDAVWTVPLLTHDLIKSKNIAVSEDTVTRSLKEMGYVYKRPSKLPAGSDRITPEEKIMAVNRICEKIKELTLKEQCVIYALDESHFSTEPYLVRGWFFKRWPPPDSDTPKARKSHVLWMLESSDIKILLEEIKPL